VAEWRRSEYLCFLDVLHRPLRAGPASPKFEREVYSTWQENKDKIPPLLVQDLSNIEAVQRGMRSLAFRGGRTNPKQEVQISHHQPGAGKIPFRLIVSVRPARAPAQIKRSAQHSPRQNAHDHRSWQPPELPAGIPMWNRRYASTQRIPPTGLIPPT